MASRLVGPTHEQTNSAKVDNSELLFDEATSLQSVIPILNARDETDPASFENSASWPNHRSVRPARGFS